MVSLLPKEPVPLHIPALVVIIPSQGFPAVACPLGSGGVQGRVLTSRADYTLMASSIISTRYGGETRPERPYQIHPGLVTRRSLKLFPVVFYFRFGRFFSVLVRIAHSPIRLLEALHLSRHELFLIVQDESHEDSCYDGEHAERVSLSTFLPSRLRMLFRVAA